MLQEIFGAAGQCLKVQERLKDVAMTWMDWTGYEDEDETKTIHKLTLKHRGKGLLLCILTS